MEQVKVEKLQPKVDEMRWDWWPFWLLEGSKEISSSTISTDDWT